MRFKKKYHLYSRGFEAMKNNIEDLSYGLIPAPMGAQEALDILVSYLLGDNFYVATPMNQQQFNACAIEQILDKYSKKWKKDWKTYMKDIKIIVK